MKQTLLASSSPRLSRIAHRGWKKRVVLLSLLAPLSLAPRVLADSRATAGRGTNPGNTTPGNTAPGNAAPGSTTDSAVNAPKGDSEDVIQKQIQETVDKGVKGGPFDVTIIARQDGKFVAVVRGSTQKAGERAAVEKVLADFVTAGVTATTISLITVLDPGEPQDPALAKATKWLDTSTVDVWPLTFLPSNITSTIPGADKTDAAKAAGAKAKDGATDTTADKPAGVTTNITVNSSGGAGGAGGSATVPPDKSATPAPTPAADAAAGKGAEKSADKNKDATDTPAKDSTAVLVDMLNGLFPAEGNKKTVQNREKYLVLAGTRRTILQIKQILAVVDSPWPQVELNVWAFQASGSRESVSQSFETVTNRIRNSSDYLHAVQAAFQTAFEAHKDAFDPHRFAHDPQSKAYYTLLQGLKGAGFEVSPIRALSLNEMLILLSIADYKTQREIIWALQVEAHKQLVKMEEEEKKIPGAYTKTSLQNIPVFERLTHLYLGPSDWKVPETYATALEKGSFPPPDTNATDDRELTHVEAVRKSISNFVTAAFEMRGLSTANTDLDLVTFRNAPDALRVESATADRMLNLAMESFTSDMYEMFLAPLVAPYSHHANGVELVGQTRLVVTSGLETALVPTVSSYIDTTNPKPLGADFITGALGTAGLASVLPSYSGAQVLGLSALLAAPEPEYTKVSPGIELHVRPNVLPGSGAARLQFTARFGVDTQIQTQVTEKNAVWKSVPAPAIQSHNVQTDATVIGYDLFNLSSFSLTSAHPRSKYLPVIGTIPILRDIITKAPKTVQIEHQSLLLVNAVIVPRSFDVARFYNRSDGELDELITAQTKRDYEEVGLKNPNLPSP